MTSMIKTYNKKSSYRPLELLNASKTLIAVFVLAMSTNGFAQVEIKGINTAPNLAGSFGGESLPRDSGFSDPLDLLNDFYPSIEVRLENHSNIRRRSDVEESDNKLIINPGLAYRTDIGRHGFYAAYSGSYSYHSDFKQENSNSNNIDLKLGLDLSKRWDLDVFAGFGNAREERGVSGTRDFFLTVDGDAVVDDGPDRIDYDVVGFDLIYGRKLGVLTAVVGYERGSSGFSSESGDEFEAGGRDRSTESVHFDINYRLGGKTSVFARIQRSTVDFNSAGSTFDSQQTDWLVGLRAKATSRLSGTIGYGQTKRDFVNNSESGYDGNNYYANLTYSMSPFSIIKFGAARSVEEPGSNDAGLFVSELFSVSWEHGLTDNLTFDSYVKTIDDDFDNGRHDEFFDWGVGLNYAIEPWLTLGAYYEDIDRDSNVSGVEYEDRIFGIRLKSDLRSLINSRQNNKYAEPISFGSTQKTNPTQ